MAKSHRYETYNYIEGNTVRKLQPEYEPKRKQAPRREQDSKRAEQIRRNRERSNVIDMKFMLVIACSCVMILASCISYLRVQAQITSQKAKITALQSELNQLNNENVAKEEQLNSSIDLDAIYKTATTKLGMKYADAKHVILYESADPDYVRQYQDIPNE